MTEKITTAQEAVKKIFENLNLWRHLPKYQLERRADMFFGLYVKDIVENHFNIPEKLSEIIIPEFPLKKDGAISDVKLIWKAANGSNLNSVLSAPKDNQNPELRSVNVDYALFAKDGKTVYFVELKTEMDSINKQQIEYLAKARESNFNRLCEDIEKIKQGTKKLEKYECLQSLIKGIKTANKIEFKDDVEIKIVYIQPRAFTKSIQMPYKMPGEKPCSPFEYIYFSDICSWLEKQKGKFPKLFSKHLDQWKNKAGSTGLTTPSAQ